MQQFGFFNEEKRYSKLSELGDSLERLNDVIDWEAFRPILTKAMIKMKPERKGPGGRPPTPARRARGARRPRRR